MSQKTITISIIIFFFASAVFLSFTENSQHKLDDQWFLYFQNPKDNSLNFTIENHSQKNDFSWQRICQDKIIQEGVARVKKNESKTITVSSECTEKNMVKVSNGEEVLELYKNIDLR
ncbi:MAG: hypothetical protein OEV93_04880 [Candidatus Moranbacteria bacterium]|nr:hypothetical protein [Candidatus Moranbacteria bacterium]